MLELEEKPVLYDDRFESEFDYFHVIIEQKVILFFYFQTYLLFFSFIFNTFSGFI